MSVINPYDCIKIESKPRFVSIDVDYYKYMKCIETDNSNKLKRSHNQHYFSKEVFSNSPDALQFKGGAHKDIFTDRSVEVYQKYKQEILNNEFYKKIQEKLVKQNKRRRTFTDKDGDFDYDRRFDIAPYSTIIKQKVNKRVVDFNIYASFSAAVDKNTINKYAAIICILNDIFNTFNISTNVYSITDIIQCSADLDCSVKMKIKDSNTYSTTQTILRNVDSIFFRRAIFGLIVLGADAVDKDVRSSLGSPKSYANKFQFKNGEINIYSGFRTDDDMNQFFKELYENI